MVEIAMTGVAPADQPMARLILESLYALYPGWTWTLEIPDEQNVIKVRNLTCDPRGKYGIVLHKSQMDMARIPAMMRICGGEFLERFNMERRAMREEDVAGRQMIFEKPEV